MGKGTGKKKKPKKKASGGDSSSSSSNAPSPSLATPSALSPSPAPMRVTSDSNVPVRHQLRWAKLNKEYRRSQENASGPGFRQQQKKVVQTAYRRSWNEEEIELSAQARKRKGQDPDWAVILNRTAVSPLVIVDGYNIIHAWARLKKHMNRGDLRQARQLLVDDLEILRSVKGWRIEVVFDGTRRSTVGVLGHGPGGSNRPTRMDQESKASVSTHGVRVVYSGVGREADAYIEARCAAAKNVTNGSMTGQFIVASSDSMIRLAGTNAGAWCMSADRFVSELKALKKVVEYRVEAAVARVNSQTVNNQAPVRFGRRSVLIEDKRNRTKTKKPAVEEEYELELNLNVETDEHGIPWWAQLPNATTRYK
jgi:predicted RNA-binding protein with PIN domain